MKRNLDVEVGEDRREYAARIRLQDTWGGAIDLALLAKELNTNLIVVSFGREQTAPQTFQSGSEKSSSAFLLYDGFHFDPVVFEDDSGAPKFKITDPNAAVSSLEQVSKLAEQLTAKGKFTDLSQFDLRCLECREPLNTAQAMAHAKQTGHTNFAEF